MPEARTKTILFTERAVYRTIEPVIFEKGSVHELREDLANRWISRGVAVDAPASPAIAAPAGPDVAEETPREPATPFQRRRNRSGE